MILGDGLRCGHRQRHARLCIRASLLRIAMFAWKPAAVATADRLSRDTSGLRSGSRLLPQAASTTSLKECPSLQMTVHAPASTGITPPCRLPSPQQAWGCPQS